MIERHFTKGDAPSSALYSECELHRYHLTRIWDESAKRLNIVMLNPSKATEVQNDPTIERCERRARFLGYGAVTITNLFALRETEPAVMRAAAAPVGEDNDRILIDRAMWSDVILAAWGVHGVHQDRHRAVTTMLAGLDRPLCHLGLTKDGHPRHPLYVAYRTQPQAWRPDA